MSNEFDEATKHLFPQGVDSFEVMRHAFLVMPYVKRVETLRVLDQHAAADPRRSRDYAALHRKKRELEALHDDLMVLGK